MADKDATPEVDATEEEVGQGYKDDAEEVTEPEISEEEYVSERQKAMDAIAVKRDEEFQEEMEDVLASEEPQEEKAVEEESSPFFKDGDSWYTTIKVDGEDIQVPFDDLKASHQKDKASQKRFEEAAEYGRKVQEREAQLNAYVQNMQKQQTKEVKKEVPPSEDAVPEKGESDSDLIKQYHQALYEDDADKAAELFTKALGHRGRSQPATQNVEEVVEQVLGRTLAQQRAQTQREQQWAYQKSLEDAVKWFDSEYPDVAGVSELRAVADNRTVALTEEHPDWTPKQIMQEAAESTRQWAKEFLSPNKNERVERKKKIVQNPKAATGSSKIGEDEPAPLSTSDIIKEMKESRGQML